MKNNLFVLLSCVMLFAVSLQYCCYIKGDDTCHNVEKLVKNGDFNENDGCDFRYGKAACSRLDKFKEVHPNAKDNKFC